MRNRGFTIVELLIVIVVIAILAAISIVAYNGVQNRANDSALKSDLRNVANQIEAASVDLGAYPYGASQLTPLNLKVSKSVYGKGFILSSLEYNLIYCRVSVGSPPTKFALVASSKSGNTFVYKEGSVQDYPRTTFDSGNSSTICNGAGITQVGTNDRDIFFIQSNWASYIN